MGRSGSFFALALLLVLSSGCDQSANRVSTLWTNVPEMASYVEDFNAAQREWQILVVYKENLGTLLTTPGRKADLVVARGLASTAVKDTFVPLDFLFDGGNLAKGSFYRRALDAGLQGDRTKLIPVSFDLNVLILSRKLTPDLPGFSLSLDEVRDKNAAFALNDAKSVRRLAFSPRWEGFSLAVLGLRDAGFQEGFQGALAWDSSRLTEGLKYLKSWPSPGWDQVTDFQRKYLQTVPGPMLVSGRIQFYPGTLARFLSLPWEERRNLDFRFVDQGGRIAATDTTVWAGIPSSSLTRGAAERFLAWFFRIDTQTRLIREGRTEDSRAFGLAGGLSALMVPNTTALAASFPEMVGRIPGQDQVTFWPTLPLDWETLKAAVVQPWLETGDPSDGSLKAAIEKNKARSGRN